MFVECPPNMAGTT